ncbi:MAG: RidA family protein [Bryobacterales bacterium]|nr:RidA family protein [Bryobacterales bacterium]
MNQNPAPSNSKSRRKMLAAAVAAPAAAMAQGPAKKKTVHYRRGKPASTPLYSEVITYGDFIFVSGHGTNKVGGIREQTKFVLDEIEKCLEVAGSSMKNALKCNVYLAKLEDYQAMNEVYRGRFGDEPPVRTTVSISGIPLDGAVVEIELIAHR